jgi:hypothetical protein
VIDARTVEHRELLPMVKVRTVHRPSLGNGH